MECRTTLNKPVTLARRASGKEKQEFLNVMISILFVAGIIIFSVDRHYSGEIKNQKCNDFLKREITPLKSRWRLSYFNKT